MAIIRNVNDKNYDLPFRKRLTWDDSPLFFPPGYEKYFLVIYFVTLPYIAGILFVLFYIAHGDFKLLKYVIEKYAYIYLWCVGYEILAAFMLLYLIKISYEGIRQKRRYPRRFRRP